MPGSKRFQALPEDTYEAFLSVPLVSDGELIGVINVHHKASHTHTRRTKSRWSASSASRWAAPSPNPNWPSVPKARPGAWKRWPALAQTISEESYLDRILQAISEMVAETLDSPVCSIMLVDEDRRELVISAAPLFARRTTCTRCR